MAENKRNNSNSTKSKTRLIIDNSIDVNFTISFVKEDEMGEKIQHIRDVLKQEFNADSIHIHMTEEIEGDEDGLESKTIDEEDYTEDEDEDSEDEDEDDGDPRQKSTK
jgi:hypothetical protein